MYLIMQILMIYGCYLNDDECTTYSYAYSACELIKCLYNTSSDVLWWWINHALYLQHDACNEMSLREHFSNDNCYFPAHASALSPYCISSLCRYTSVGSTSISPASTFITDTPSDIYMLRYFQTFR